jgi:Glycosyltransferase family 87
VTTRTGPRPLSPQTVRALRWILGAAAVLGAIIGIGTLRLHLAMDPLADVHAYYDAGSRLNAGLPLYQQAATTDDASFYRYPPLLAIAFRPLALLPFETAAAIWTAGLVIAAVVTVWLLLRDRPPLTVAIGVGILAMPVLWSLAIGQAQVLVTLLLVTVSPLGVAVAGWLKLTPWLVGVFWVARRDVRQSARLLGWIVALGILQLVLEPAGTIAYLGFPSLGQVGDVVNLSPWAISPWLWVGSVVVLAVVAWLLAPTRWGWPAAVVLAVFVTPRLLAYQLSTLLAALARPRPNKAAEGAS